MPVQIEKRGDATSKTTVPDFNTEKAYHYLHMRKQAERAGVAHTLPRKPRKGLAEKSFFRAVDVRLSRASYVHGVSFDENGRLIRE